MSFRNPDDRIRHFSLRLERELDELPSFPLAEGYRFVFYKNVDREAWIDIEVSAGEAADYDTGLEYWNEYFEPHENELSERMVFIETMTGEKVATATAFYDISGEDLSDNAWLHWVAVKPKHQGKGLSRPLVCHVLEIMKNMNYNHVIVPTHTSAWVACNLYLKLGFRPTPENAVESETGWQIIRTLTESPFPSEFEKIPEEQITNPD